MTGAAATAPGRKQDQTVVIVPQKEAKVNIDEAVSDLKLILQNLSEAKFVIEEQQEEIRQTISRMQMSKEGETR